MMFLGKQRSENAEYFLTKLRKNTGCGFRAKPILRVLAIYASPLFALKNSNSDGLRISSDGLRISA